MDMSITTIHNILAQAASNLRRTQPLLLQLIPMLIIKHHTRLTLDHMVVHEAFIHMALVMTVASPHLVFQLHLSPTFFLHNQTG